ncbi:MAG: hypothetical protein KDC53_13160 [Saprospiraceae bacterium]|nr:hypothetical protein [Saprospiraceae bacterium]
MKKELFKQLISEQQAAIAELNQAQNRSSNDADLEEGATMDPDDQSHQNQSTDLATFYGEMKTDNKAIIHELERAMDKKLEDVAYGAIVETEKIYFIIGIAVPNTTYQGKKVVGVSAHSPVFRDNENRTAKEKFILNERLLKIISIN